MSGVIPAAAGGEFDLLREPRRARRLRRMLLVNNEGQQLASLRARLEVICETIAQRRMEWASVTTNRSATPPLGEPSFLISTHCALDHSAIGFAPAFWQGGEDPCAPT